jgi:hypothetical protein
MNFVMPARALKSASGRWMGKRPWCDQRPMRMLGHHLEAAGLVLPRRRGSGLPATIAAIQT